MNPSVQDRLDSCVRALEHVILPALPESASLAREQVMLVMGQIGIIRAQLDATPAFEAEEASDLAAMADALVRSVPQQADPLRNVLTEVEGQIPRERTAAIQTAIDQFLVDMERSGGVSPAVKAVVCDHGLKRAEKDRAWFAAMGFDAALAE
ncbi:MAG: hypothetical protein WA906_08480 [Pacificimonas sp.]